MDRNDIDNSGISLLGQSVPAAGGRVSFVRVDGARVRACAPGGLIFSDLIDNVCTATRQMPLSPVAENGKRNSEPRRTPARSRDARERRPNRTY